MLGVMFLLLASCEPSVSIRTRGPADPRAVNTIRAVEDMSVTCELAVRKSNSCRPSSRGRGVSPGARLRERRLLDTSEHMRTQWKGYPVALGDGNRYRFLPKSCEVGAVAWSSLLT